jgi:hypothetical protein
MSDPRYDTPEDKEAEALVDLEPVPYDEGDSPQDEEAPNE